MPLSVALPLTLRIDPRAARDGRDRLDEAVRAACGRATRTAAEALEGRGDYLTLNLNAARFTWRGDGLHRLGPVDRAATEAVIDTALRASVSAVLGRQQAAAAPDPLADGEGAAPDPDRMLPGGYLAPSYDTKPARPRDQLVFVLSKKQFQADFPAGTRGDFYHFTDLAFLNQAFRAVLRSAIAQGLHPPVGILGCLYVGKKDGHDTLWVGLARHDGNPDSVTVHDRIVLGNVRLVKIKDSKVAAEDGGVISPGVARYVRKGSGTDYVTQMQDHFDAALRPDLEAEIKAKKLPQDAADALRADFGPKLRAQVATFIEGARTLNPGRPLVLVEFVDGAGSRATGPGPDVFDRQDAINIYPIIRAYYDPKGEQQPGGDDGAEGGGKTGKGRGGGGKGNAGDGDETGEGGEGEGGKPAGGGSEEGEDKGTSARFVFPRGPDGAPVEIDLGPLNTELSFDDLGAIGAQLRDLMRRIAFRLSMPEGDYPGSFLVAAARVWGARAANCSGFEGVRAAGLSAVMPASDLTPLAAITGPSSAGVAALTAPALRRVAGGGSLGDVDFKPADSPVLRTLRHLGGTVPPMSAMSRLLYDAYRDPANAARLGSHYTGNGVSWHLHFLHEYSPAIRDSIAFGFKVACKSCLIQLCLSSRHEILLRLNNFDRYAPLVEGLLVQMVAPQASLHLLRRALNDWLNENRRTTASTIAAGYATWREARHALSAAMGGDASTAMLEQTKSSIGKAWTEAKVELGSDDVPRVRDANGKLWTMAELEQAIALGTGTAQAIDPLVRKIVDLPQAAVMARADPAMLRSYLRALLNEMLAGNTKITSEAEGAAEFAFRASKISEDLANASVPGTTVVLGGLHLLAHQAIGDSFLGDSRYGEGLDHAFGAELGRQGIIAFFEFTGTMFLSVVCPPLGALAGAVVASVHLQQAHEQMDMLKGLMDEGQVMSLADAELDLFLAELETVFAIIPMAGKVLKFGAKGTAAVVRSGVRAGAKKAFRGLAAEVAREMAEQLKYGLVLAFMKELASSQVVGQLVEKAITPAIQSLMHEIDLVVGAGAEPGTSAADEAIARTNLQTMLDEEGATDKARSEGAEIARKGRF